MSKRLTLAQLRTTLGIKATTYEAFKPSIQLADGLSATILQTALKLGIADRTTARPFVTYYIAEARNAEAYKGQRGVTFGRGTNYSRQVDRILAKMFTDVEATPAKPKSSNKTDAVAKLLKAYQALTGAEKRRFKAAL
jgi:hypothetical protein